MPIVPCRTNGVSQNEASKVLILLFLSLLFLSGCKQEDPNPELLDGIFVDLDKRATDAQKGLEDETKKLEDFKVALSKAEPNSIELKNARRDIEKSQRVKIEFEQRGLYYKIRAKRRLLVDRLTYKAAFAKNLPWPDPHEYSDYQVNMRLEEASRNWGARVPKLQDRLASAKAGEKGKETAPKSEE